MKLNYLGVHMEEEGGDIAPIIDLKIVLRSTYKETRIDVMQDGGHSSYKK